MSEKIREDYNPQIPEGKEKVGDGRTFAIKMPQPNKPNENKTNSPKQK